MMKFIGVFLLLVVLLESCSGSDTYRGKWNATDTEGNEVEIVFNENDFTLMSETDTIRYEYNQHSVNISNSVETYGINVKKHGSLQIQFPIAQDETKGAILDENNYVLYIISRKDYLVYEDIYGI